jgi:hypothetical protein
MDMATYANDWAAINWKVKDILDSATADLNANDKLSFSGDGNGTGDEDFLKQNGTTPAWGEDCSFSIGPTKDYVTLKHNAVDWYIVRTAKDPKKPGDLNKLVAYKGTLGSPPDGAVWTADDRP